MRNHHGLFQASEVGDDAHAEATDAALVGHNDFGNGAHAHGIGSPTRKHAVLGGRLVGRALRGKIDAVLHLDAVAGSYFVRPGDKLLAVGLAHVGEAGAGRYIRTVQRVLGHVVDVVGDYHQVAYLEVRVRSARRIADEESLDAQLVHDADRERHLLHRVAFVVMESALHRHDVLAAKASEDEFAGMAFDGGDREVGNLVVGDGQQSLNVLSHLPKAGAKHNGCLGGIWHPFTEPRRCCLYFLEHSL